MDKDNIFKDYLTEQLELVIDRTSNTDELMKKYTFKEEFSFCEVGYEFDKFEGIKTFISKKYDFLVIYRNTNDFFMKNRSLDYEIYIPFKFLEETVGITSNKQIETLEFETDMSGETINEFHQLVSDVRNDIETEILEDAKKLNIAIEVDF